ncbi:MAG: hypothetical protein ACRDN0_13710 [Trebonia sp.]
MYTGKRRRRWIRWFLVWFFGTTALMVIGLVVEQAVSPSPNQPQSFPPTAIPTPPWATSPAPAASPSPSTASTSPALTGTVQLVQGREEINGVYLGFPQSTVGAVSAADEFVSAIGGTLDPDRAAAVMRMVADPSYANAPQQAAEGAVNDRKSLGLPAGGPVPQGASFQILPVEYQVRDVTPDQVTVLLLSDFISATPGQGTQTSIGVFPARMHWAESDWKILADTSASYENLQAQPDSPQAATLGWQNLDPAGG